ncbi:MAG: hypothetical protein KA603_02690 [Azonexus sp.]|nr:hypothetical protein [Betaproteobacteria bacterium]MBK8917262.1 hypothetical protein [Betaproteobacteria bacterium]MBP6035025.1 hypothetical protein [Azonexus sp.]MBP6905997.1 hypothetical protein [Azonexus sp.]
MVTLPIHADDAMTGPEIGSLKGCSVTLGRYSSGVVVRARRPWIDSEGRPCPADFVARIQQMTRERFDPFCPIDVLFEDEHGVATTLRYAISREGPAFEDLFEAQSQPWGPWPGQEVPPPPSAPHFRAVPPPQADEPPHGAGVDVSIPANPPVAPTPPHGSGGFQGQIDQALALLSKGQAVQAHDKWTAYVQGIGPMGDWGEAARLARQCSARAMALRRGALISDPVAWCWLREQAMRFWYSWAGQATSGGEGTAMMGEVRAAEREFADAEREHVRWGGAPIPGD